MKDKDGRQVVKKLFGYACRFWPPFAAALFFLFISVLLGLVPPWLIQYGVDNVIAAENKNLLIYFVFIMIFISLLKGVIDFLQRYLSELAAQRTIHNLRAELYQNLNRLSFYFYDESKTGDIISRLTSDTETLRRFFSFVSINIIANIATITGVLVILLYWDIRLGMLYLGIIPLMFHAMKKYSKEVSPMFKKARLSMGGLTNTLQETFSSMETVKLLGGEEHERRLFEIENTNFKDNNIEAARISSYWMPYVHFLLGASSTLVIFFGGWLVILGEVSIGILLGFTSYLAILTRPIRQTGMMINLISRAIAGGERIFELMEEEPEIKEKQEAVKLPPIKGHIKYENVSFSYHQEKNPKETLENINFEVNPAETVAIVGPTGAGKTTLVHLLPRFYEPTSGKITIDGYDLRDVKINSLRKQIGIAMQHDMLFSTTIKDNISYGNPGAGEKDIIRCARLAHIHDFIASLAEGYETHVGERGVKLSGGEKQRIIIARLILQDPNLVIMDESTSHLDENVEGKIQAALTELFKNRTVFVIAHRLWTVKNADKILVIKDGKLVEKGTHQELSSKKGVYKNMVENALS